MTKKEYLEQRRAERLAKAGPQFVETLVKIGKGEHESSYDNSKLWTLRESIATEIAPKIRRNQLAWANSDKV